MPYRSNPGAWDDDDHGSEDYGNWSGDNWSDNDWSDNDWSDDSEDEPTIPCPYCGREIHEESPRCPGCGNYISTEDAPPARKPWWIVVGTLLVLYVVYRWIAG